MASAIRPNPFPVDRPAGRRVGVAGADRPGGAGAGRRRRRREGILQSVGGLGTARPDRLPPGQESAPSNGADSWQGWLGAQRGRRRRWAGYALWGRQGRVGAHEPCRRPWPAPGRAAFREHCQGGCRHRLCRPGRCARARRYASRRSRMTAAMSSRPAGTRPSASSAVATARSGRPAAA